MLSAPPSPATNSPLDQSHHRELAAAAERARPIRRAVRVATFNAWTTAVLAALSAPFALFSTAGLVVFAGLTFVAWNEFRGRRRLVAFDPTGATILGCNQLGFLALITAYCGWALYSNLVGANSLESQLAANPELSAAFGSLQGMEGFDELYSTIVVALYGSVIVLSAIFQGAIATYYFTRRKHMEAHVRETPAWVLDFERAARSA